MRAEAHRLLDEHLKAGGCAALQVAPCFACTAVLLHIFNTPSTVKVHYADDFEKYASTACGEMVGNTWARSGEPETEDVEDDWSKVTCEDCIVNREIYEEG